MLEWGRSRSWFACIATAATALALVAPSTAHAYCRSTTCTGDCPRDDEGCKTSGEKLFWPSSCVGVSLQKDSSEFIPFKYFEQTAQKAFVEWSDLSCDTGTATMSFSQLDDVACHKAEYNTDGTNANIILFQDTKWNYTGVDNNLAKTTVTFNDETGEILDADIEVNHANNNFTISDMVIEYDLQAILTHEIGHLIGLDHSPDFSATMYAGYEPGTTDQRSLEPDDVFAVCDAYPPERQASCRPEPNGGIGDECGGVTPDDGDGGPADACSISAAGDESGARWSAMVIAFAAMALAMRRRKNEMASSRTLREKGDG
ncbi:MAG: matrixin family metalloprotease [Polyangiaceae bacterium]|nr:matrixin family metalloprotease [Polyangiaceae bacterium]